MFGWWTYRKRNRILLQPVAENLTATLTDTVWQYGLLPPDQQRKIVDWTRIVVSEKNWEGCNGFQLTEGAKIAIAGQAALMTLAYSDWYFDLVQSVLVYPQAYVAPSQTTSIGGGIAIHSDAPREGEAWYRGPVILNWRDVIHGGQSSNNGHSLVIHEFAHQMDMINDRTADGIPPLPPQVNSQLWQQTIQAEFSTARTLTQQGHKLLINDYGLTSPSEFYAVASELFFQLPHELAYFHPNVFNLLLDFYQYDFRVWLPNEM